MGSIVVDAKIAGQKRPVFSGWRVELPGRGGDRMKLRDLIARVVAAEVDAFRQRQAEQRLARVLSPAQIEQGAAKGKIDPGERELQQPVDTDQAVAAALQAYEDGLYFVFIDGQQQAGLDSEVYLKSSSQVTFLRLVALSGG